MPETPPPPPITTYKKLKAYAEEHSPETFAKLSPKSCYIIYIRILKDDWHEEDDIRIMVGHVAFGAEPNSHVLTATLWEPAFGMLNWRNVSVVFEDSSGRTLNPENVRFYEPFCWVAAISHDPSNDAGDLYAYIHYCLAL
jgi:hypothetical protein